MNKNLSIMLLRNKCGDMKHIVFITAIIFSCLLGAFAPMPGYAGYNTVVGHCRANGKNITLGECQAYGEAYMNSIGIKITCTKVRPVSSDPTRFNVDFYSPYYNPCVIQRFGWTSPPGMTSIPPAGSNPVELLVKHRGFPKNMCASAISGNPIDSAVGNKTQIETDYFSNTTLSFVRIYNSDNSTQTTKIGKQWKHNYDSYVLTYGSSGKFHIVHRWDGKEYNFYDTGSGWWKSADINDRLIATANGWDYITEENITESYNSVGALVSITDNNGLMTNLEYDIPASSGGDDDPTTLDRVTDPFGKTLTFRYNNGNVETMSDPEGNLYYYGYDANGNLATITYPDHTPVDPNDNPVKTYHYEDANFVNALTGITDEKGIRYATWSYDSTGKARSSEHANGTASYTMDYSYINHSTDPRVTVTNPMGKQTIYHFTTKQGVR
ncbi:MAG: DUF6531 domain-containing protein, partial [Methylococcaceae bacterium]|nr:DUF6531 domain-containing protein [Methylococcaceae bacterium]